MKIIYHIRIIHLFVFIFIYQYTVFLFCIYLYCEGLFHWWQGTIIVFLWQFDYSEVVQ